MFSNPSISRLLAVLLIAFGLPQAEASIVVNGTRFVYAAKQPEISVRASNEGTQPSLVQAWVDRGDPATRPEQADAPFLLMPPIFRLDPGKGQSLRLTFTGEALPADRESVFWLNVLDVPPQPQGEGGNFMQFAIRTRVKLFYRPVGLPGSAADAIEQVSWRLSEGDSGRVLRATNASAFHVSFSDVALESGGQRYEAGDGMLPPFGTLDLPLPTQVGTNASGKVVTHWINDYGAPIRSEAKLAP
ncbi:fimbrial biogenesis chaperone [Metapseudomonas furukawaii]|jgi:chaperone protein EcpD|uniref:Chaperone protein fimC n=1 Tax=Metapseudomonas furukawaii TaxID=1149133 RepID=A0AAD1FDX2_METFU|nr:fimbria/pilus periplasmic chaperone [Pseudomonas furukawaii]ELS28016.1 chaperone protein ecpD precursor [Pseudomonas furukawaii]BAU72073.1 chaperone protein fimC precursor [Pseudomonas furukawaii]